STMTRQVLFVQGGGEGAYQADARLAASLGSKLGPGYDVRYPMMPDEASPDYAAWRQRLSQEFMALSSDAVLVGHSLGGSILLKVLADGAARQAFKGMFLIAAPYWVGAGWGGWTDVELSEDEAAWLSETIPLFFYHSRDDEEVPCAHL